MLTEIFFFLLFISSVIIFSFVFSNVDASREEYFERNFAWHAITQYAGEVTCNCKNASIMYLKPVPDPAARDRLGLMVNFQ